MVRMIRLPILILVATVGCATVAGPPLTPPVATLLPDSPKEYRWSPFKWKPGITLTYNVRRYTEQKIGDRQVSKHSRYVSQMRGMEGTAGGIVRVQFSVDGTDLGFAMVDEAGRVVDAVASSPEGGEAFKDFVTGVNEDWQEFSKLEVLRVGECFRVEYPRVLGSARLSQELRDSFKEPVVYNYDFIGYAMLGEKMVVGLRFEVPNILKSTLWEPLKGSQEGFQYNTMTVSGITYRDPVGGFMVSDYSENTTIGLFRNQQIVRRTIKVSELDWQKSSGF